MTLRPEKQPQHDQHKDPYIEEPFYESWIKLKNAVQASLSGRQYLDDLDLAMSQYEIGAHRERHPTLQGFFEQVIRRKKQAERIRERSHRQGERKKAEKIIDLIRKTGTTMEVVLLKVLENQSHLKSSLKGGEGGEEEVVRRVLQGYAKDVPGELNIRDVFVEAVIIELAKSNEMSLANFADGLNGAIGFVERGFDEDEDRDNETPVCIPDALIMTVRRKVKSGLSKKEKKEKEI